MTRVSRFQALIRRRFRVAFALTLAVTSLVTFSFSQTQNEPILAFASQPPGSVTAGHSFSFTVQIQDSSGNVSIESNDAVSIRSVPAGLNVTVNAVNGVATF